MVPTIGCVLVSWEGVSVSWLPGRDSNEVGHRSRGHSVMVRLILPTILPADKLDNFGLEGTGFCGCVAPLPLWWRADASGLIKFDQVSMNAFIRRK